MHSELLDPKNGLSDWWYEGEAVIKGFRMWCAKHNFTLLASHRLKGNISRQGRQVVQICHWSYWDSIGRVQLFIFNRKQQSTWLSINQSSYTTHLEVHWKLYQVVLEAYYLSLQLLNFGRVHSERRMNCELFDSKQLIWLVYEGRAIINGFMNALKCNFRLLASHSLKDNTPPRGRLGGILDIYFPYWDAIDRVQIFFAITHSPTQYGHCWFIQLNDSIGVRWLSLIQR